MKKEKTTFRDFDITNYLTDEKSMAEYLNLELAEGDPRYIKLALSNIARARNMSEIAKKAGIPRATIYRALDVNGNPEYNTIQKIVDALGMKMIAVPKSTKPTIRIAA
jgi:probable addiction module antidote protein